MRLIKLRISVIAVMALLAALGAVGWFYYQWKYPYGYTHCCDKCLASALREYADAHNGAFPSGEANPEASLSLLYPEYPAALLCGKTSSPQVAEELLKRGERLSPESCSWHYVDGLTTDDDPRIGVVWDKVAGLGHFGQRLADGGRNVILVSGAFRYVPASEWDEFMAEQQRLLAVRKK
ncbi:MAG: hypothetical protein HY040_09345 [Planctomycetes bacterium]|nr:hypothetical protein [Planctomycetota bacterium]